MAEDSMDRHERRMEENDKARDRMQALTEQEHELSVSIKGLQLELAKQDMRYSVIRTEAMEFQRRYWQGMAVSPREHDAVTKAVLDEVKEVKELLTGIHEQGAPNNG